MLYFVEVLVLVGVVIASLGYLDIVIAKLRSLLATR